MEGQVTDFFNEINRIAPAKDTNTDWRECFDESSGYPYYWNMKTNKVTWNIPVDYKSISKSDEHGTTSKNVPPRPAPLFPSTASLPEKAYKGDAHNISAQRKASLITNDRGEKRTILMASYGDNSDSDEEEPELRRITMVKPQAPLIEGPSLPPTVVKQSNSQSNSANNSDREDEDIDLLTKLQNRAKVLTQLGGELPASVKKIVSENGSTESVQDKIRKQSRKSVTGFSLVAGYSDSDEDDEISLPVLKPENKPKPSSTLFPLSKPIDVSQFNEPKKETTPPLQHHLDTKVFQRRKRIGIDFIDRTNKTKIETTDEEHLGLGFKSEKEDQPNNKSELKANYSGFKSGGVMFMKPDSNDTSTEPVKKNALVRPKQKIDNDKKYNADDIKIMEEARSSVSEKLHFLAEGRELATPVQTMIIQLETLHDAMKAQSLSIDYFYKWLHNTSTELVKLERGAAPTGWILKWDRIVKRYYYRNQQTGDCQWDYPQPDIVGGDEAMDISTTPPPPPIVEEPLPPSPPQPPLVEPAMTVCFPVQPPPPPRIKSPTPPPPPPPTISHDEKKKLKAKSPSKRHLTKKSSTHTNGDFPNVGEPLPPGVDLPPPPPPEEEQALEVKPETEEDALGSALNSFYSDLASLESAAPVPPPPPPAAITTCILPVVQAPIISNVIEKPIKKKKAKVKIVEGLAMKKKGVSKLVEKWKKVQKDY